jgi:mannose-1-phosphate guanylyltransferase
MGKGGIRRGMILCAGLGTRMLPISQKQAKPLVPVLNVANVLHNIHVLKAAGVTDIILNLHHLGESIESFLGDGRSWGVSLSYSAEKTLLGTAGGVKHAQDFFGGEPFVVFNCDFVTNIDILPAMHHHLNSKAIATMVLIEDPARQPFFSKVGIAPDGQLCSFPRLMLRQPVRSGIFTGIQFLSPEALDYLKDEPSDIIAPLYYRLMKTRPEKVRAEFAADSYWYDTGDLDGLWESSMALLRTLQSSGPARRMIESCLRDIGGYYAWQPQVWAREATCLPPKVNFVGPVVIGPGCDIAAGSTIGPFAVIGEGARILRPTTVANTVVLPHATVENSDEGIWFENQNLKKGKRYR